MTRGQRWCAFFIVAAALLVRLWALDYKPAHFDEGVNGSFVDGMKTTGYYAYDPANYHGPLHFYTLFAAQQMFGRSLWVLRMPTVLIGTATVFLLLVGMRRHVGFQAAAWAAAAMAVSPAMVFYSRYAIHEMWLPFFSVLACIGAFGLVNERRRRDLWCVGLGLAGMVLTKETYALHFIAAFIAWTVIWLFAPGKCQGVRPADLFAGSARVLDAEPPEVKEFTNADVARVVFTCTGIIVAFYSGFFMHWDGVGGIAATFEAMYTKGTDGEEGHNKEMLYWIKLLAHYEWPALAGMLAALVFALPRWRVVGVLLFVSGAALVGMDLFARAGAEPFEFLLPHLGLRAHGSVGVSVALCGVAMLFAVPPCDPRVRWCALYGLGSLAAYSLIPYKTPWCIVNVLWPFALTLGCAMRELGSVARPLMVNCVGLLLLVSPAIDTLRLNFNGPTERPNPTLDSIVSRAGDIFYDGDRYAYVQTNFDVNNLLIPLNNLVTRNPSNHQLVGHVFGDPFPLIWLLGDFPNVHFHEMDETLAQCDADFLLIPDDRVYDIEPRLQGIYYRQRHRTRGPVADAWLYLLADRFRPVMPAEREPELVPRVPQFDEGQ